MPKSYEEVARDLNRGIAELHQSAPAAMDGFSVLARNALKGGALSELHKELMALAIGVAGHCDGCIAFHARKLAHLGAARDALMETLAVAVYMGGGPSLMYAAEAVNAFEEFSRTMPGTPKTA